VHFADANTGYAVGEYGTLLYTWDGGQTWLNRQSGGQGVINRMDANDVAHAWAAADQGRVIRTADGGNRWEQVPGDGLSGFGDILDVDFYADDVTGWAVGFEQQWVGDSSRISRSTDGGRSWTVQYTSPTDYRLETIAAVSPTTAVAMGQRPISGDLWVRTTDGGATWQDVTPPPPVGAMICSDFVNRNLGFVAGGGIWKTTDGGATWKKLPTPNSVIEGISFADRKNGWAVGGYGYVIHTTDGGRSWKQEATGQFPNFRMLDVSAVSPTDAWLVGDEYFAPFRRLVAFTHDGGQTWQGDSVPGVTDNTTNGLRTLDFVDPENGWVGTFLPTGGLQVDGGLFRRTGPTPAPVLSTDRLLSGSSTRMQVTGATPGDLAAFFVSPTGVGGTQAFRLLPPAIYLTTLRVDGAGSALLAGTVPPGFPGYEIHFQVLVATPGAGVVGTNTVSALIEP